MTTFVALGDSITVGMGDPAPEGGGWRGWAALLGASLQQPVTHNLATLGALAVDVERLQLPAATALKPDVALFHAPMADRNGNVFVGIQRELFTMAHASRKTVVTVEKIHDGDLLRDPLLAAGILPGFYVEAVAVEPRGAWPLPLPDHYGVDAAHLAEYARLAATPEGFAQYLNRYVHEKRAA